VNNAMTPTRVALADATVADWDVSMRVNVRSLFLTTRAVTPVMARQGGGSIVNISSGAAAHEVSPFMPPGYVVYSVAKAALERYSSAAAGELRPLGITINALRPGAVRTEHTESEFGPDFDWTGWARPESVVEPVAYLARQIDTDVTGLVLDVSGFGTAWGP
jgi:NAD(P)-dependent dehydrogenase (short-subunit alcohol dehydrogenase family)